MIDSFLAVRRRGFVVAVLALAALLGASVDTAWAQQRNQSQRAAPPRAAPAQPAAQPQPGQPPEVASRQAVIIDYHTGEVLFEKNADERMAPSSMSKIMTAYMVFKAIKEGRLKLTDELPVSERAWRIQGSKMFVMIGSRVKVEDLVRGMIIQSGNDACIVLAEALAGTEDAFADRMNEEAKRIGLSGSNFRNSSGWPDPDHYMTARDLAALSKRLIDDFPEHYKYYSEKDFTYGKDERGNPIRQGNRNPLLYRSGGADGIKTGHTDAAGYGLTASAVRDGRRVIMVLNGMASIRQRMEESERLMDYAYREFTNYTLVKAGQNVEQADVWLGQKTKVGLSAAEDVIVTMPRRLRPQMTVKAVFDAPIAAPIEKGAKVGTLTVELPGRDPIQRSLVAEESVERLGFAGRIMAAASYMLFGSGKK